MNIKDLTILNIISDTREYKKVDALIGTERALLLFKLICVEYKNIAFQSIAMQLGLQSKKSGKEAFEYGADILVRCKDTKLYELKTTAKSIYIVPLLQFSKSELPYLEDYTYESHDEEDFAIVSNKNNITGRFNMHDKPINLLFLNKIRRIGFRLDMDVVNNFEGENMPINHKEMIAKYLGKVIKFNWKYDTRGRSYSEGYGLNIQGNSTVRASLQFDKQEVINDIEPLYIALASAAGHDDWTWKKRIAWAKKRVIDYEFKIPRGCKKPEKYVSTIRAILNYEEGNPSGYMMELDATASGIQIMGALAGCEETCKHVNLINTRKREDVYVHVASSISRIVNYDITRDYAKYPTMTHYYNSIATPKEHFDTNDELFAFYNVLEGLLPGAEYIMKYINKQWNPRAKYHSWTLPDGHVAFVKTMTQKKAFYKYNGTTISYLYYVNEGNREDFRSLAPNIVHSIDGYIARQMVLRANFDLVHVHDCFLFHPNHYHEVKELYRTIMAEIARPEFTQNLFRSLNGKLIDLPNYSHALAGKIMKSEYAIA